MSLLEIPTDVVGSGSEVAQKVVSDHGDEWRLHLPFHPAVGLSAEWEPAGWYRRFARGPSEEMLLFVDLKEVMNRENLSK